MATGGGGGFGSWLPPSSPGTRQMSPARDTLVPDTEENVVDEAEDVIKNFMYQRYQEDLEEEASEEETNSTPRIPQLVHFTSNPMSQASQVGRQLARIGDDINRRYADEFNDMISQLNITEDTAYDVFAGVARKLFAEGINWGRVSALLCFAYRIAIKVLKVKERARQFADFLKLIISHVVRFIKEKIASWIAQQGGWGAALTYNLSANWTTLSLIAGSCFLAIVAAVYFTKKGSGS